MIRSEMILFVVIDMNHYFKVKFLILSVWKFANCTHIIKDIFFVGLRVCILNTKILFTDIFSASDLKRNWYTFHNIII